MTNPDDKLAKLPAAAQRAAVDAALPPRVQKQLVEAEARERADAQLARSKELVPGAHDALARIRSIGKQVEPSEPSAEELEMRARVARVNATIDGFIKRAEEDILRRDITPTEFSRVGELLLSLALWTTDPDLMRAKSRRATKQAKERSRQGL